MYRDIYAAVKKSVAYTGVKGIIEMIQKHGECFLLWVVFSFTSSNN